MISILSGIKDRLSFMLALAYMVQVPLAAGYMKLVKFADERKEIKMSLEVGNV